MTVPPSDGLVRLRDGSLEWRLVEGEVVLLDGERAEFLAVNRTGAALWTLLVGGASRDELAAALVERFEVEAVDAAADVDRFLSALAERQLLQA